jgi:hypothetical protein
MKFLFCCILIIDQFFKALESFQINHVEIVINSTSFQKDQLKKLYLVGGSLSERVN